MNTKQADVLNTQNNTDDNHNKKSDSLIERKQIEGTPFTMIKQENRYFLVMGDHRLTEPNPSEEETLNLLEKEYWRLLITIIAIVIEKIKEKDKIEELKKNSDESESL